MKNLFKALMTAGFLVLAWQPFFAADLTLDAKEKADLTLMREEEKLARDVYLSLYDIWKYKTFSNIASSEQQHMNSVKTLLDYYKLDDPVINDSRGVFSNPVFSSLYKKLVAEGSASLSAALNVGVQIEKLDISDLEKAVAGTDEAGIKLVYDNLLKASRNHLKAFSK